MTNLKKILTATLLLAIMFLVSCDPAEILGNIAANFEFTPNEPALNQEVKFTSKALTATYYEWNFGDGKTASGKEVKHTYTKVGEYVVKHTITDTNGKSYSKEKTLKVTSTGGDQPTGSVIKHSKDIAANETWSNKFVHIVTREIDIIKATLTIEPGTKVIFDKDAGLTFGYYQEGQGAKLIAKGTANQRIIFTSSQSTPQAGDWDALYFGEFADHESIMEYCDVIYGGGKNENPTGSIHITNSNILFNHNRVSLSSSNGICCNENGYFGSFEDNEVSDCEGNAIYIRAQYAHTLGVTKGVKSRIDNNSLHGIYVDSYYGIYDKGTFTWQDLGARYTISEGSGFGLYIGSTQKTTLVLEAGVTLAFMEGSALKIGTRDNKTGALIAKGTKGKEIRFVSEKVGNSNAKWDYLHFGDYNSDTSVLDYCIIEDGGGDNSSETGAVYLNNTMLTINNTLIKNSKSHGIYGYGRDGRFKEFTGNTITNSAKSSIYMSANWAHTIGENNKIDNDGYGIGLHSRFSHKKKTYHWLKQTCPYTFVYSLSGSDFYMGSVDGCTLIIDAGNRIQFAQGVGLKLGIASRNHSFTFIAKGTEKEPITFAPATETGTWDDFYFGGGTTSRSILENCEFVRGGASSHATLITDVTVKNAPVIRNCAIRESQSAGIYIYNNSDNELPLIENVKYIDCKGVNVKYHNK